MLNHSLRCISFYYVLSKCTQLCFYFQLCGWIPKEGGGVLAVAITGGLTELHISNPPKIYEPEILQPKYNWHQNFLSKKIHDLNMSILLYSVKHTLRPRKIRDRSFDPPKY